MAHIRPGVLLTQHRTLSMENTPEQNVTRMLRALSGGDQSVQDELWSVLYPHLKKIAGSYMWRERPNHTLQRTGLVSEAYMRLADQFQVAWENREHFFKLASKIMRQVLIDYARERRASKRGGGQERLPLDEAIAQGDEPNVDFVLLHEALSKYEQVDPKRSQLVELSYYGGFSNEEIARIVGVSVSTVKRDLRTALAWLRSEMG